jgi:hypothetical protein
MLAQAPVDRSHKARALRRKAIPNTMLKLGELGVFYDCLDRLTSHYRPRTRRGWVVDFWPTTERWYGLKEGAKGEGLDGLLSEIKRREAA